MEKWKLLIEMLNNVAILKGLLAIKKIYQT